MKLFFFLLLILICGCRHNKNHQINIDDVPWYISISDNDLRSFNAQDSLSKYSNYLDSNKDIYPNINCYLADLKYLNGNKEKARKLISRSFNKDLEQTVENYLISIYNYLVLDRPHRHYSKPPILIEDFEHFVALCHKYLSEKGLIVDYEVLLLKKINILDQWYRTPNRKYVEEAQLEYDMVCQAVMDSELYSINLSTLNNARNIIFVVILHAKDCEWVERWIIKYADDFRNNEFLIKYLNHFLYRSDCRDSPRIEEALKALLSQSKKVNE